MHHLDMLRRRIRVEENAIYLKGAFVIGTPKPGEPRVVPMPVFLAPVLARLCEGKRRDSFLFGRGDFPKRTSHAASGLFVRAVRACQDADNTFPTITPHDLRNTAASLAISTGANVKAVQRMLGHSSAAMTLDVYADLFDDDLDGVATAMTTARELAVS